MELLNAVVANSNSTAYKKKNKTHNVSKARKSVPTTMTPTKLTFVVKSQKVPENNKPSHPVEGNH